MFAIIVGVALVAYGAPGRNETQRGLLVVALVCAAIAAVALAPILVKLMSDAYSAGRLPAAGAWAAIGLSLGVVATLTGMTAFQRLRATTVVPVSTAVQTFMPIVLEPVYLRESWSTAKLSGVPLIVGLVCAGVGILLVSRADAVGKLAARANA